MDFPVVSARLAVLCRLFFFFTGVIAGYLAVHFEGAFVFYIQLVFVPAFS